MLNNANGLARQVVLTSLIGLTLAFVPYLLLFSKASRGSQSEDQISKAPITQRPNILFILADDLDSSSLRYMPKVKSLLIDQGISFNNYLTSVSICCPSRATILRGQYAHNTGVKTNLPPFGGFQLFNQNKLENSTLATWLQNNGYYTALLGKYLNGYPDGVSKDYIPPGWTEWYSAVEGFPYSGSNYVLNENGRFVSYGDTPKDYGTDVYINKALNVVQSAINVKKPFFVYLSVYPPHTPAISAQRHANLFPGVKAPRVPSFNEADVRDKPNAASTLPLLTAAQINSIDTLYRKRLQSLQALDEGIAKLHEKLVATNQLNNTYILFVSDNGFHLGQHRRLPGKSTAFEEDIRVPFVIRGPRVPAGKQRAHLVGNLDLAPTIADLTNSPTPGFVDGRSLVPLLSSSPPALKNWRQAYLLEHWTTDIVKNSSPRQSWDEPPDMDELGVAGRAVVTKGEFYGVRTQLYNYVEYVNSGDRELYNLGKDPYQLNNVALSASPTLLQKLSDSVARLKRCARASCRVGDQKL